MQESLFARLLNPFFDSIDPSATSAAHCGSSSDVGSALSMYSF